MKLIIYPFLIVTLISCRSAGSESSSLQQAEEGAGAGTGEVADEGDEDVVYTADNCLADQDMNEEDVDISNCPPLPSTPASALLGEDGPSISLGAWELGTTSDGKTYKYGSLTPNETSPRRLTYSGGSSVVNELNIECWAKGYYRLRKMLQDPPAEYVALRNAGFQVRFFQFQTDLRNGPTGFKKIASYQDHLVKWVTVIDLDGNCIQPTRQKFVDYSALELIRRGISLD